SRSKPNAKAVRESRKTRAEGQRERWTKAQPARRIFLVPFRARHGPLGSAPMHFRLPAFGHGVAAFLWALGLALYVWLGLLAIGTSQATAFVLAAVSFCAIFLFVRLRGEDPPSA